MLFRRRHPESPPPVVTEPETPPHKTPPILFRQTQDVIARIEALLGQPFVSYWNSSAGSVCGNDVVALHHILRAVAPEGRLALFIKSDGGSGEAALRMVHLMRQYADDITALVPLEASSAATMLALGANRILMGPIAKLSAVDTSLTHALSPLDRDNDRVRVSQDELVRVLRLWQEQAGTGDASNPFGALYPYIHPLVIGAVDRVSALSTRLCTEILSYHMEDTGRAGQISHALNGDYPSHSYPITMREACRIGIPAEPLGAPVMDLLMELNALYSEMGQKASTDIDENNAHDESILNILEGGGLQIFFQNRKDWHYRESERRWVPLNNFSTWKRVVMRDGQPDLATLHIM